MERQILGGMNVRNDQLWPGLTITLLVVLIVVLPGFLEARNIKALRVVNYGREGNANFLMANNLEGKIQISSSNSDNKKMPRRINLLDLDTDSPSVIFEGVSGARIPFRRLYEDQHSLVIQQQAGSSLDTITINKANGVFVRTASGIVVGTYAIAEKGQLD